VFVFGYKADIGVVERTRAAIVVKNVKGVLGNVPPYDVPIALKKVGT
jgi:hypothetical protein